MSYFKVVGALKDVGYVEVNELFYCIETILHKLYDDRGVMNMINMEKYNWQVHLFVVYNMDEPEVIENQLNEVVHVCQTPLESGKGSRVSDSTYI